MPCLFQWAIPDTLCPPENVGTSNGKSGIPLAISFIFSQKSRLGRCFDWKKLDFFFLDIQVKTDFLEEKKTKIIWKSKVKLLSKKVWNFNLLYCMCVWWGGGAQFIGNNPIQWTQVQIPPLTDPLFNNLISFSLPSFFPLHFQRSISRSLIFSLQISAPCPYLLHD